MSCITELVKSYSRRFKNLEDLLKIAEIKEKKKRIFEKEIVAYDREKDGYKRIYISILNYLLLKIRGYVYLKYYSKYLVECSKNKYILSAYADKEYIKAICNF